MKATMVSIITSALLFTFGCNYDYGESYGKFKEEKDKTESNSEQKNTEGAVPSGEADSKN